MVALESQVLKDWPPKAIGGIRAKSAGAFSTGASPPPPSLKTVLCYELVDNVVADI